MWENTVITNAGIELLKNALSGGTITVTAIKSGAGKVDVSALKSQTAVSSFMQKDQPEVKCCLRFLKVQQGKKFRQNRLCRHGR